MYKVIAGFVFGVGFLIVAGVTALSTREFLRTAIPVPGEVVALNAGGGHPQVAFVTKTGERISYPQGGIISGMRVGDKVTVLYRPEAPSVKPTIDRFGAVWDVTLTTLFIGIVGIVAALTNLPSRQR